MKILKFSTLLLLVILIHFNIFSQFEQDHKIDHTNCRDGETIEYCRTHHVMNKLKNNPAFMKLYEADQEILRLREQVMKNNEQKGVVYNIPVVFHILHNGGVENISSAQVHDALDILNRDFRLLNADASSVQSVFQGMPSDIEIEFVLATKAPNGQCFSGITRTQNALTNDGSSGAAQVTAIVNGNNVYNNSWAGNKYLNIFVVNEADGAAGYTTKPSNWSGTSMTNGIWVLHDYVGSIGTGSTGASRTLTHEVGHWLNLDHLWGGNNNPGNSSSCNDDDNVDDTPRCIGLTSCNLTANTCSNDAIDGYWSSDVVDNTENYMEYSYCSKMFTDGQRNKMRSAITSGVGGRNNLWQTSNLNATGGISNAPLCKAEFSADRFIICQGETINFTDESFNGIVNSWNWTFTGGSPSANTSQNPSVTYNTPGTYAVSLQVSDGSTTLTETKNAYITVGSPSSSSIAQTVCNSQTPYTAPSGIVYTSNGIYSDTIPNSFGCDSIITIDLTFLDSTSSTIAQTVCESYTLNGQTFNTSGTYTQTLTNVAGCDSIITLNLTVLNSTSFDTQIVCDSYTSTSGSIYTFTGIYIDTIPNSVGCDSVITLDLTITGNSSSSTNTQIACDSYTSSLGMLYTSTGIYIDTIPNSVGCDSVITLDLTITGNSSTHLITQSSCGSYTLNNQTYSSSGTYTQTLTNVAGCDSTITLNLTVNPNQFSPDFTVNQTLFTVPPFAAQFTNTTPNASNYNFTWDFSDGTILQSNNPSVFHEYLYNGLYDVTLIAEDINTGCTDTIFYDDYIFCTGGTSCTHASTINQTGPITACLSDSVFLSCNTDPNFTYQWRLNGTYIPGAVDTIYYPTQTGNYSVLIMDSGCPEVSPDVSVVISSSPQTPIITSSGNITPCLGGSVTLSVPATYTSYNWSSGGISSSEVVNSSGSYFVTVSNSTGCEATSPTYTINASFATPPDVCIVGVDSITNYNKVVWEKPISTAIDSFYVYKESNQANIYQKIGGTSYSDTAVFNDLSSNPAAQAYRYKLSLVDSCGIESSLGSMHKSIHLTINQGVGTTWNLIWSHYEGFTFPSYNIYRGTSSTNMTLLTTIASNLNSYTDLTAPAGQLFYQIEVVSNYTCDPLKSNYNVSRSNVVDNAEAPSIIVQNQTSNVNVFPNPTQDQITIDIKGYNGPVNIKVYDLQGRLLETTTNTIVSLKKHAKGIYVLKVSYGEITEEVRVVRE